MEPTTQPTPQPAPLSLADIKASIKARHAGAVSDLAEARKQRAQLQTRIAALVTEVDESARILRSVEGRKPKK